MNNLTDQQKGSLLAFVAVMFITPDSLFIRLSNIDTWGLVFYRGIIPFVTVLLGMLIIYKLNFENVLLPINNQKERQPTIQQIYNGTSAQPKVQVH